MTYYPSGSIAVYMKIKSLVGERFSNKRRKPYVIFNKRKGNVFIIIRRETARRRGRSALRTRTRLTDYMMSLRRFKEQMNEFRRKNEGAKA